MLSGTRIVLIFASLNPLNGMTAIVMAVTETPLCAKNSKQFLLIPDVFYYPLFYKLKK